MSLWDDIKSFFIGSESPSENMIDKNESVPVIENFTDRLYQQSSIKVHNELYDNYIPDTSNGNSVFSSYNNLYKSINSNILLKRNIIDSMESIRNHDYVEVILRDLATEVLTRSYDKKTPFFLFKSDVHESLVDKVNIDIKNLKLYNVINDIIEDYLLYGEYIIKMDYANNELDDSIDQSMIMPAYSKSSIEKVYDEEQGVVRSPGEYLILRLFHSRVKLDDIKTDSGSNYYLRLPRGIILQSIIPKITNLKLLESLQPAIELQAIDEKMYFYARFPSGNDVKEAYKQCRDYEKLLKSLLTTNINSSSVNDIIENASRIKVIPLFGDQSEISQQSITKINRIELSQVDDLRNSISNALKIKINGDNSTNPEYFKLVKRIRDKLAESIKEFIYYYVKQKYSIDMDDDEFDILVPDVHGSEDLDLIDYINMHQSTYKDAWELVKLTSESLKEVSTDPTIDQEVLVSHMTDRLSKLVGSNLFKSFSTLVEESGDEVNPLTVVYNNQSDNEE